jgi:hypothetical protein
MELDKLQNPRHNTLDAIVMTLDAIVMFVRGRCTNAPLVPLDVC